MGFIGTADSKTLYILPGAAEFAFYTNKEQITAVMLDLKINLSETSSWRTGVGG